MGPMCVWQAITVPELYGVLDADTRDWTDGLLSNIFRDVNKPLVGNKVSLCQRNRRASCRWFVMRNFL
jgi:hypothetical protein